MFYRPLQLFARFAVNQFFSKVTIAGEQPIPSGPQIIVCNHPNMMLDSALLMSVFPRELWYLAKSTLFRGPLISKALRAAHLIPIYRQSDNPQDMSKNEEVFRAVVERLLEGAAIAIFPEGVSMGERKLNPVKTGAARMAFQAESARDFSLGLTIQPVGLTYSHIQEFRSSVTVLLGPPIQVATYAAQYASDEKEAVRQLTSDIEDAVRALTVEVADEGHRQLVEKIAKVYSSARPGPHDFERLNLIAQNVIELEPKYQGRRKEIEQMLDNYLALSDEYFLSSAEARPQRVAVTTVLLSPFVAAGAALHVLPYRLIRMRVLRQKPHPAYSATLKLSLGIKYYLLWYALLFIAGWLSTGSVLFAAMLLFAALLCGVAANSRFTQVQLMLLSIGWPKQNTALTHLHAKRDELLNEFESLRVR